MNAHDIVEVCNGVPSIGWAQVLRKVFESMQIRSKLQVGNIVDDIK